MKQIRSIIQFTAFALAGLLLATITRAASTSMSWPDEPQRGVNLGTWLKSSDLATLSNWGTKIVRAQLVGSLYAPVQENGGWTFSKRGWEVLDNFLAIAKANKLKVIVDFHEKKSIFPDGRYATWSQEPGAPGVANKNKLVGLWQSIATRYKDERDVIIAYEILNEPHPTASNTKPNGKLPLDGADAWNAIMTEVVEAIRKIDTYHNIVVEPVGYANQSYLERLVYFDPEKVPGIIYSVHIYSPHEVMEQGSKIATEWKYGFDDRSGYYYPGMFDRVTGYHPAKYTPMLLDRTYLENVLAPIKEFQKTHKEARIYIGEFGAKRWAPVNLDGQDSTWVLLRDYMQRFNSADIPGVKYPHWDWTIHAYRMAANDAYTGLDYSNGRNDNARYKDTNKLRLYKHYLNAKNDAVPSPAYDAALPDARIPKSTPDAPWILAVTKTESGSIKLTWAATPRTQSYKIKRATAENGPFVVISELPVANAQGENYTYDYTDAAPPKGEKCHYTISATNEYGESADGKVACIADTPL